MLMRGLVTAQATFVGVELTDFSEGLSDGVLGSAIPIPHAICRFSAATHTWAGHCCCMADLKSAAHSETVLACADGLRYFDTERGGHVAFCRPNNIVMMDKLAGWRPVGKSR